MDFAWLPRFTGLLCLLRHCRIWRTPWPWVATTCWTWAPRPTGWSRQCLRRDSGASEPGWRSTARPSTRPNPGGSRRRTQPWQCGESTEAIRPHRVKSVFKFNSFQAFIVTSALFRRYTSKGTSVYAIMMATAPVVKLLAPKASPATKVETTTI